MTNSTAEISAWERLGVLLKQRRAELGFRSRKAFTDATGLDYRLIYDVEEARRTNFGVTTLTAIEIAYQLEPGSISRLLAGGALRRGAGDAFPEIHPDLRPAADGWFDKIRPHVERAIAKHPEAVLLGEPIRGDWVFCDPDDPDPGADDDDAWRWDSFTARGWSLWQAAMAVAVTRALDPRRQQEPGAARNVASG